MSGSLWKKKLLVSPSLDSLQKLLERSRERAKYKEQTKDVVAADLLTDKITYHEICYANIASTAKLESASVIKKKAGRPCSQGRK